MKLRKIRQRRHSPVTLKSHNGHLPRLTQGLMDYTSLWISTRKGPGLSLLLGELWAGPHRAGLCTAVQPCHRAVGYQTLLNLTMLWERTEDWHFSFLSFSRGQNKHLGLVAHFPASCPLPHSLCCCTVAAQSHFKAPPWNPTDRTRLMFPSCRKICSENKWKIINANFTFFISKAKWHHISESLSKPKILFEPALIMNKLQVQAVLLHKRHQ